MLIGVCWFGFILFAVIDFGVFYVFCYSYVFVWLGCVLGFVEIVLLACIVRLFYCCFGLLICFTCFSLIVVEL